MKPAVVLTALAVAAFAFCDAWAGATSEAESPSVHLPWKEAGLTERQAAAHLLNRFAFGPRPGEVDAAVKMGLDRWFERQLAANLPDGRVEEDLRALPALRMSTREIAAAYPPPVMVLFQAREAGVIPENASRKEMKEKDRAALKDKLMAFAREQGYHSQKELIGQLMTQKLLRAVESENQLSEVMTDFWFNHFNVSLTDKKARSFLLPYERDTVRPHALGRFRDLLEATAKSPAMLLYLDNAQSSAAADSPTTMGKEMEGSGRRGFVSRGRFSGRRAGPFASADPEMARRMRPRGVNENYARELMELHTLGVDGGYTQQDVVEVARAFTGWSLLPPGRRREMAERRLARVQRPFPGRPGNRGRRGRARPPGLPPGDRPAHRRQARRPLRLRPAAAGSGGPPRGCLPADRRRRPPAAGHDRRVARALEP
jgi:Protein of unknown function (DUF1800)